MDQQALQVIVRTESSGSTDNILRLLLLVSERRSLKLSDVVREMDVAKSTAHRMLTVLRRWGFVQQEKPNGTYLPGPALLRIGLTALSRVDVRRVAMPVLVDLRAQTQETISLVILDGRNVRFVESLESPRSVRVGSRLGMIFPAHSTAGGKSMLAEAPPYLLRRLYCDRVLDPVTENTKVSWPELLLELTAIRADGFALNFEESEVGLSAVGVAIHDNVGSPVAALAVAAPAARLPDRASAYNCATAAMEAAREIERLLIDGANLCPVRERYDLVHDGAPGV